MSTFAAITLAPGWERSFDAPHYYIHRGRVYLTGAVRNARATSEAEPAAGALLGTVPGAGRPSFAQALTLPINPRATTDACNEELDLLDQWAATIHPDGTLLLDEPIPPSLNAPPPAARWFYEEPETGPTPQYATPFALVLVLANASWTLTDETDHPTLVAFPLTLDFTDLSATIGLHDNRVHLGGAVSPNEDGATEVTKELPAETVAHLQEEADYTTAIARGLILPLSEDIEGELIVLSDEPMGKRDNDPPLVYFRQRQEKGLVDWDGLAPEPGLPVSGSLTIAKRFLGPSEKCVEETVTGEGVHKKCHIVRVWLCGMSLDPDAVHLSFDLDRLLPLCLPMPRWFVVHMEAKASIAVGEGEEESIGAFTNFVGAFPTGCHKLETGCPGDGCKAPDEEATIAFDSAPTFYNAALEPQAPTEAAFSVSNSGFVLPPGGTLYEGNPHIGGEGTPAGLAGDFIWREDQATALNVAWATDAHQVNASGGITLYPLYERRQFGLHAGDVLHLKLTGWESATPSLTVGPSREGVIHLPLK